MNMRCKGYIRYNRPFTIEECQKNADAIYYYQIDEDTLAFSSYCEKHDWAILELIRNYYPVVADQMCETDIIDLYNEFLFTMYDYDNRFTEDKTNNVTIWLPNRLEAFSKRQINMLEEDLPHYLKFESLYLKENEFIRRNCGNVHPSNCVAENIQILQTIIDGFKQRRVR